MVGHHKMEMIEICILQCNAFFFKIELFFYKSKYLKKMEIINQQQLLQ